MKIPAFLRSAALYTAANLLNAVVPILLLPVLTHYLTKEDYGLVSLFQVMIMVILPFAGLNIQGAIEREYFNKRFEFKSYLASGLYILFFSSAMVLVIVIIFRSSISALIEFPEMYLWSIVMYCLCHNLSEVVLSLWRVENKPVLFGLFRIGRTLTDVVISILFVTLLKYGWLGRIEGMVITAVLFSIIAFFILFKKGFVTAAFDLTKVKDIIKFGVPLIPHTLSGVIMIYSDRIFITKMEGLSETGSYAVGFQVAMGISLLQASFNLAWVPWFYEKLELNSDIYKRKIVKFTYLYNLCILMAAIALTLVSPILFKLFIDKDYYDSMQFVFWIALGFAFDGMYKMLVNYIFFVKKTHIISVVTISVAILNLILNYFFITWYGAIGAAKATAVCMLVEFIGIWIISNRLYPMPWFQFKH
jgi:O-antigen/teichoic acid export membrane protein